jgi:hypothetical protein
MRSRTKKWLSKTSQKRAKNYGSKLTDQSWSQSYDRDLQRQRCKNLQRLVVNCLCSAFWKQKYFRPLWKTVYPNYNAGVIAVNSKVVGLGPDW